MDDSKGLFSAVIKKQIEILGTDIVLARVKKVSGINVDQSGNVIIVTGQTQFLLEQLTDQFLELSGLIVKKTMESLLLSSPIAQTASVIPAGVKPDNGLLSANRDIEELNKVLAGLNASAKADEISGNLSPA